MDYQDFDLAQFLTDDAFLRWVNQPDEASDRFWNQFLTDYPHQFATVQRARQLAQDLTQTEPKATTEDETTLQRMWGYIEENTVARPVERLSRWPSFGWYAAAASVVLLLGAFLWFGELAKTSPDLPAVMQTTSSDAQVADAFALVRGPRSVQLPDSSRIQLSANSSLRFPKVFELEKREVYLIGEAFFDVTRRPEQPFLVHTDDLVTRVVGTSFRIKAYGHDRNVSVDVKTGKVAVSVRGFEENSRDRQKSVTLTPNQKVVYEASQAQLQKSITDNPVPLNRQVDLRFDEAPIAEVILAVEREYGIPIRIDKVRLAHCTLTTSIDGLPLFDQMKLICRAVNATYVQKDGGIVVQGGSCR